MGINIVILASGSGTNAEQIIQHFERNSDIHVRAVLSNKADAYVLKRAEKHGIDHGIFTKSEFQNPAFKEVLAGYETDFIILAGFLWKVPEYIIRSWEGKIINIHPALLPKYGGKGMYGMNVHRAVIAAEEKESGITIHLVNEHYDEGAILFQAKCQISPDDDVDSLANKIHQLEHQHFPRVIQEYIEQHS